MRVHAPPLLTGATHTPAAARWDVTGRYNRLYA